jgi:hypothetical protein
MRLSDRNAQLHFIIVVYAAPSWNVIPPRPLCRWYSIVGLISVPIARTLTDLGLRRVSRHFRDAFRPLDRSGDARVLFFFLHVVRTIRFASSTKSSYKEHSSYSELLRPEPGLGDLEPWRATMKTVLGLGMRSSTAVMEGE